MQTLLLKRTVPGSATFTSRAFKRLQGCFCGLCEASLPSVLRFYSRLQLFSGARGQSSGFAQTSAEILEVSEHSLFSSGATFLGQWQRVLKDSRLNLRAGRV